MPNVSDKAPLATPWLTPWPVAELQAVDACPVCASTARAIHREHLVDNVFRVAAGRWTLYRCTQCHCAYLDPRPDEASIGKAYDSYYTHEASLDKRDPSRLGGLRRWKLSLFNGYINQRYGTRRLPASNWGSWALKLLPRHRQRLDVEFRYLPRPEAGQTLLDIGCGNGDFLTNARAAGWHVSGIDPDPKAVAAAAVRGIPVSLGSVESLDGMSACFDAITLSHVLEHVHEPRRLMRNIHRLLKPGGVVYVDTPNIGSKGAALWQNHWRGLETPRHLVLFSLHGLLAMLTADGFDRHEIKRRTVVRKFIYLSSLRMFRGESPMGRTPKKLPLLMRLRLKYAITSVEHDEFLTVLAWKTHH